MGEVAGADAAAPFQGDQVIADDSMTSAAGRWASAGFFSASRLLASSRRVASAAIRGDDSGDEWFVGPCRETTQARSAR